VRTGEANVTTGRTSSVASSATPPSTSPKVRTAISTTQEDSSTTRTGRDKRPRRLIELLAIERAIEGFRILGGI
jgi:hypothetical protein